MDFTVPTLTGNFLSFGLFRVLERNNSCVDSALKLAYNQRNGSNLTGGKFKIDPIGANTNSVLMGPSLHKFNIGDLNITIIKLILIWSEVVIGVVGLFLSSHQHINNIV